MKTCFLFRDAAKTRARVRTGSIRVSVRQVAPRPDKDAGFRSSGGVANSFATDHENGSDKASGAARTILSASLLRTSSILLRRSHADGQCVDAEWVATIRAVEHHAHGNVSRGKNLLEERGRERRARNNTNIFQIEFNICKKPDSEERAQRGLTWSDGT